MKIIGTPIELISWLASELKADSRQYDCELKLHRKKRSLDANGYYWKLLNEFADWARVSKASLHNDMIARYGQPLEIDDKQAYAVIPDTHAYMELTDIHLRPTSEVKTGKDGKEYRTFVVMRGSHSYDTAEMSILISGLISEIKGSEAPIETLTPDELKRYGL